MLNTDMSIGSSLDLIILWSLVAVEANHISIVPRGSPTVINRDLGYGTNLERVVS